MSMLTCRYSIAVAAVGVALFTSTAADAQVIGGPYATPPPQGFLNDLVTGAEYDIVNQAKAEQRLGRLQSRLQRDSQRGDMPAVNRDSRQIANTRYRIAVDEWLIRKNTLRETCYYPVRAEDFCINPSWYYGKKWHH